ncbi:peptidase U32 family protein [Desulfurobacterium sp.]
MELLLPAGSLNHTFAAFDYGADACYLGIGSLNARAGAVNFSSEDYRKALAFSRERGKKLYLTFNTLLKEKEIDQVFKIIDDIYDLLPDGIIVQDIGLASLIKREFPGIPLIASTQMGFHNVSGVKFAEDFGFKRVILSRELTLKELESIRKSSSIQLEVFIHGAICFSFSGYCFASSFLGGNSGNRGKCSQVCRMFFKGDVNGFAFNLKDLAGFDFVKELYEIGIDSLKIEGRLKDELYVAVNAFVYRQFIDAAKGKIFLDKKERERLKKLSAIVFSRKRWNGYFVTDHPDDSIDPDFPGNYGLFIGKIKSAKKKQIVLDNCSFPLSRHDGILIFENKEPVPAKVLNVKGNTISISSDRIFKKGSKVYLVHSVKVQNSFPVKTYNPKPFKPQILFSVRLGENLIEVKAENPVRNIEKSYSFPVKTEPAQKAPVRNSDIVKEFKKSGDFLFEAIIDSVKIEGEFFVRRSELSKIRKELFSLIEKELFPKKHYRIFEKGFEKQKRLSAVFVVDEINLPAFLKFSKRLEKDFIVFVKTFNLDLLKELIKTDMSLGLVMPLILKTYEEENFRNFVHQAFKAGIKNVLVPHYYGIEMLKEFKGLKLFADYTLYTLNRESAVFLKNHFSYLTISVEDDMQNIESISDLCDIVTIYQDTPLFQSQTCIKKVFFSCPGKEMEIFERCPSDYRIKKIAGKVKDSFKVKFENCRTILLWDRPLNLNRLKENFSSFIPRFDFVYKTYTEEEMEKIFSGINQAGHIANTLRGLS